MFHETIADPKSFIATLREKLSERHRKLIDDADKRQNDVAEILQIAGIKPNNGSAQPPESQLLKAIIDYECRKSGAANKDILSPSELSTIRDNFYQIRGLYHERYWINLLEIVRGRGVNFLQPDEHEEYEKLSAGNDDDKMNFLMKCVAHKLNPIWWFVVSLSRCLQTGEHTINPIDAYWLGLADEVIGSDLPSLRTFVAQVQQHQQTKATEQPTK